MAFITCLSDYTNWGRRKRQC